MGIIYRSKYFVIARFPLCTCNNVTDNTRVSISNDPISMRHTAGISQIINVTIVFTILVRSTVFRRRTPSRALQSDICRTLYRSRIAILHTKSRRIWFFATIISRRTHWQQRYYMSSNDFRQKKKKSFLNARGSIFGRTEKRATQTTNRNFRLVSH